MTAPGRQLTMRNRASRLLDQNRLCCFPRRRPPSAPRVSSWKSAVSELPETGAMSDGSLSHQTQSRRLAPRGSRRISARQWSQCPTVSCRSASAITRRINRSRFRVAPGTIRRNSSNRFTFVSRHGRVFKGVEPNTETRDRLSFQPDLLPSHIGIEAPQDFPRLALEFAMKLRQRANRKPRVDRDALKEPTLGARGDVVLHSAQYPEHRCQPMRPRGSGRASPTSGGPNASAAIESPSTNWQSPPGYLHPAGQPRSPWRGGRLTRGVDHPEVGRVPRDFLA